MRDRDVYGRAATTLGRRGRITLALLAALLVAGALLALASWRDVQFGTRGVEHLMQAQARTIADLVSESGSHGFETFRLWEDEVAARLLDNARWVARLDSARTPTPRELERLAELHHLGRINLFDARGEKVVSSRIEQEEGLPQQHDPRDYIGPVLRGEVRELRIGFKPARYRGGHRFAVAVARRRGGAVVVNVFADSMRAVLESVRPGHLLRTLGSTNGVRYVVLATRDSVLAASPGAPLPGWPAGVPGYRRLGTRTPTAVRELSTPQGPVYEVARLVSFPGAPSALLRVGMDASNLEQLRRDVGQRAWMRAAMFLVVSGLLAGLLLVWQRHDLLAREVARARAEIEAREQEHVRTARLAAMGEMAAHVAHEIRNPLNTIHMIAQEMSRAPAVGDTLRTQAADVRGESRRIELIVQQFLDFARPRTPQPVRLDVHATVEAAVRTAQAAFTAAGLGVAVSGAVVWADLDPVLLREVLENLLRNAREASPAGTRTTVDVRAEGGDVVIRVDDQGPGVPPELRERVFDLYFTTKAGGSGLGLSLASQMVTAMGGRLTVEAAPGGGARFVVRLPTGEDGA